MGIENIHPKPHHQLKVLQTPESELQDCTKHDEVPIVTVDLKETALNTEEVACSRCELYCRNESHWRSQYFQMKAKFENLQSKYDILLKEKNALHAELKEISKEWAMTTTATSIQDSAEDLNEEAKAFENRLRQYSNVQRNVVMNINYRSAKGYKFMRSALSYNLPHPRTLFKWSPIKKIAPGINESVCKNITKYVHEMSDSERNCVIVFDEMHGRSELEYNSSTDQIDGFVDYGKGYREPSIANTFIFFQIITYYPY